MLLHRRKEHGESEGRQPTTPESLLTRASLPKTISAEACLRFPTNPNVWTVGVVFFLRSACPAHAQGDSPGALPPKYDQRGNARVINAMVPLANMFGYVNTLRSMSQGRAQFTMTFDHYEQVPQNVADEIKAKMA
jgi:translation elongation factor EF-G